MLYIYACKSDTYVCMFIGCIFRVTTSCDLQNMLAYTQSIFHSIYIYISLSPFSLSHSFLLDRAFWLWNYYILIFTYYRRVGVVRFNTRLKCWESWLQAKNWVRLFIFFLMDQPQIAHYSSSYLDTPLFCWHGQCIPSLVIDSSLYIDTLIHT